MRRNRKSVRLSSELLQVTAKNIEKWFKDNQSQFDSHDDIGRIYITKIWDKKDRPQRIYIHQNFLGTRRKTGCYKLPNYHILEGEVELGCDTKEALVDMVG